MFFKGSRYADVEDREITVNGETIRYKRIRIIQDTSAHARHRVRSGERLDHIAHTFYMDSERFWRICDANCAMWPDDLVIEADRSIWIPPSEE